MSIGPALNIKKPSHHPACRRPEWTNLHKRTMYRYQRKPDHREAATTEFKPGLVYSYDWSGVLIRQALIDGALQKFVPTSLRVHILYLGHYPVLSGPPGGDRFMMNCNAIITGLKCPTKPTLHTADCQSSAEQSMRTCHQKQLRLFQTVCSLKFMAIDILSP